MILSEFSCLTRLEGEETEPVCHEMSSRKARNSNLPPRSSGRGDMYLVIKCRWLHGSSVSLILRAEKVARAIGRFDTQQNSNSAIDHLRVEAKQTGIPPQICREFSSLNSFFEERHSKISKQGLGSNAALVPCLVTAMWGIHCKFYHARR